ncbi:MAG: glycosyltransferase family 2 protein [Betaproteobacteria bacterium]|nr:glycosyltransferase family 2 protein [Betaproteobacteria bacterium]
MTDPLGTKPACLLTVVIPLLNEQEVLPELHARLKAATAGLQAPVELLFVDDGSTDHSAAVLQGLAAQDPQVGVIRFSRNFGKEQAMSAGLQAARGEAVVILDADLQHPPEHIPEMVTAWRAGADIVNMKRRSRRDESWTKRRAAGAFYRLINRLSDTPIPADIGDFRLLSRRAVQALNRMPERNRFMKGLFAWIGFPQVTLEYDVAERAGGATKWSPHQLTRLAVEGITAFSIQPLKFATKLGLLTALLAVGLGLFYLVRALLLGDPVPGFPTLIVVILMLGGMQLMAIGLLGEYLGRLWLESKQRPLYIVQDHWPARQFEASAQEGP